MSNPKFILGVSVLCPAQNLLLLKPDVLMANKIRIRPTSKLRESGENVKRIAIKSKSNTIQISGNSNADIFISCRSRVDRV